MQINPLLQRIVLSAEIRDVAPWSSVRPQDELVITTNSYDHPITGHPESPFWDLYDVTPAVIATQGRGGGITWAGPTGLRVGLLFITQFETYPVTDPNAAPHTAYVSPSNGTSFFHQLDDAEAEYPEYPDLFSGGVVFWGDGSSSSVNDTLSTVQHTYAAAGTYDIKLELHIAAATNFAWSNNPSAVRRIAIP